ncbi:transglutaminase-like cysteine peptidase [Desulfovibrio sp. OttesenSCG-928-F07]|nr:transglutaminase-like cysteine peptidase [Desulfovibrio sp. OttesenSCG-928-F07]
MPRKCGFFFQRRAYTLRAGCAVVAALLLVFALVPGVSYTLTLERPNVNVDWNKMPQQQKKAAPKLTYAPNRLFGTVEFRSKLKDLPQWDRVLRTYKGKTSIDEDFVKAGRKTEAQKWEAIKKAAKTQTPMQILQEVNKFFNLWPYRTDMDRYGLVDYWATPAEFIDKSGDCEDYSITKMFALIQLGFKPESMRVAIIKDKIRNIDHAVLVVYIDTEVYVLDNTSPMVLSHSKYGHYLPVVSFNQQYKWAHVPPSK